MPAILTIGFHDYWFGSVTNAAKVADLLGKAVPVQKKFEGSSYVYREYDSRDEQHHAERIEITMTKNRKPKPAQLRLPEPSRS